MFRSYKKPIVQSMTNAVIGIGKPVNELDFRSQYDDLPLYILNIGFDQETAISSIDVTVNGDTQTFTFDEAITKGNLDVLTGILTKSDSSTYAMAGMDCKTVAGANRVSLSAGIHMIEAGVIGAGR